MTFWSSNWRSPWLWLPLSSGHVNSPSQKGAPAELPGINGCFQKYWYPKMFGLQWKTLLKWMFLQLCDSFLLTTCRCWQHFMWVCFCGCPRTWNSPWVYVHFMFFLQHDLKDPGPSRSRVDYSPWPLDDPLKCPANYQALSLPATVIHL